MARRDGPPDIGESPGRRQAGRGFLFAGMFRELTANFL